MAIRLFAIHGPSQIRPGLRHSHHLLPWGSSALAAALPPATYLPAQAAHGKEIYDQTCATCHQATKFVGQEFVESWNDRRVYDFYSLVRGTMPLDNPGGLKEQEYLDVVAYLLQANHHASPKPDSLRADTAAMRRTKIAVRLP